MTAIREAVAAGARLPRACKVAGIGERTYRRWEKPGGDTDGRKEGAAKRVPKAKLTPEERREILEVCNSPEYRNCTPAQIVADLADTRETYLCCESTMYAILREDGQVKRRDGSRPPSPRPRPLVATGPNQVWTWDITIVQVDGKAVPLYKIIDIYSRKIVGWALHEVERSVLAAELVASACRREGVGKGQLTLHSDNGAAMRGAALVATCELLDIAVSYSRPSVCDDNPFIESLFRTLKQSPFCPRHSRDIAHAREWVAEFVEHYNTVRRHKGIRMVTPHQRHSGEDAAILAHRKRVYERAKKARPERWFCGKIRKLDPDLRVVLNPGRPCESDTQAPKGGEAGKLAA